MFGLYLTQPELPELVSAVEDDRLILEWKVPAGFSFPMPLEIEVNGEIRRVDMPDGRAELDAAEYPGARLDPNMWILKADRLIDVSD